MVKNYSIEKVVTKELIATISVSSDIYLQMGDKKFVEIINNWLNGLNSKLQLAIVKEGFNILSFEETTEKLEFSNSEDKLTVSYYHLNFDYQLILK